MGVLSLDVYSDRDLQNLLALFSHCARVGVVSLEDATSAVTDELVHRQQRAAKTTGQAVRPPQDAEKCPECGSPLWAESVDVAGVELGGIETPSITIDICKSCRYSRVVG